MLQQIKKLFGTASHTDFKQLVKNGAQIVDVRTHAEYQQGHVKGSINIPLNNLSNHYAKLKKDKPVVVCCASGVRSSQAEMILKSNGFSEVYNGGGWRKLHESIQ